MNRLILLCIGSAFILMGLYSLITGDSIGFSGGNIAGRSISFVTEPIEFILSVLFKIGFGVWLIKANISSDEQ